MASSPLTISPLELPRGLHQWRVPGSKSLTNRAYILAALAEGTSILEGVLSSDDTHHMRRALEAMGITVRDLGEDRVLINGGRSHLQAPEHPLFIGNSGTSVRFLSVLACLVAGEVGLEGDSHMAKRPIGDLVNALTQLGITVNCPSGCPPLTVHGGRLPGGEVHMRGDRSSQYFSALMLSGPLAEGPITIHVEGTLVSRPYVDMTRRMVQDFGGQIDMRDEHCFVIHPCGSYRNRSYHIEPDASAASYPFACAAACGASIRVPQLTGDSLQGDVAFVDILARMGCRVERDHHGITVHGPERLRGVDVDMHHISDTVMSLAAIAPLAEGPTTIRNIANIRIKETDRLQALVNELQRLGQGVEYGEDWLRIEPQPLQAAAIECYADHRIAMAFAVLGCAAPGITITDPACSAKTYPNFWQDLETLRSGRAT